MMAPLGSIPHLVPPYLAVEPIEGHGGVGGPQHAHGGRGHVGEHRLVPPPPLVLLRALVRVAAPRPPGWLRGGTADPARTLPCPEPPQAPPGTSEPLPAGPKNRLRSCHSPARPPGLAPAPAGQSDQAPSRTPKSSHNPPGKHARLSGPLGEISRDLSSLAVAGLSPSRCLDDQIPQVVAGLRRPGGQKMVSSRFLAR